MTTLNDYKSKAPAIIGSSTINHAVRVALKLTCSEYCLMNFLAKGDTVDDQIYIHTGFNLQEQDALIKSLMQKGFLHFYEKEGGQIIAYDITEKWETAFPDIEKEFDNLFWKIDGKVVWTGTRKKALEYYIKLRHKYSSDFLVAQRNLYFEFLKLEVKKGFDRQKMMCQVFLNPANERFNEDYADYCKQDRIKLGLTELEHVKPLTRDEVNNAYGK